MVSAACSTISGSTEPESIASVNCLIEHIHHAVHAVRDDAGRIAMGHCRANCASDQAGAAQDA